MLVTNNIYPQNSYYSFNNINFTGSTNRITKKVLTQMREQGMSFKEIADHFGVSPTTIKDYRDKFGIKKMWLQKPINFENYDFYYLRTLIDEGNSLSQIAEFYKETITRIRKVLHHFGLKTQEATFASVVKKEELEKLIEAGKTQEEIAKELFLEDYQTVTHLIKKFGLDTPIHKADKVLSVSKIADLLFEGYKPTEIAKKYNIDSHSIIDKMKKSGLDEVYSELYQPHDISAGEIRRLLHSGYSLTEIAEMNHASLPQMIKYMQKNKIYKDDITVDELKKAVISGMSIDDISRSYLVSPSRVSELLRKNELKTIWQIQQAPLPKETVEANIDGCKTYSEFAKRLGVSVAKAKNSLERYGLSLDIKPLILPQPSKVQKLIDSVKYISIDEIAQNLGVEPMAVERVIRKNKIKFLSPHIARDYYSFNFAKLISMLVKRGDSPVQVGEMFGLSSRKARDIMEKISDLYADTNYIEIPKIPADKSSPLKNDIISAFDNILTKPYKPSINDYGYSDIYKAKEYLKNAICKKLKISEYTLEYLKIKYGIEDILDTYAQKLIS